MHLSCLSLRLMFMESPVSLGYKLCTPGEVTEQRLIQFTENQLTFFRNEKSNILEQEFPEAHCKLKALEAKIKGLKEDMSQMEDKEKKKELRRRQSSCFKLNLDGDAT